MRIELQYSVSEAPHPIDISEAEIDEMLQTGNLTVTQPTPRGTKTITITGTPRELFRLALVLLNAAFRSTP